jgi:hypothetical protein
VQLHRAAVGVDAVDHAGAGEDAVCHAASIT